MKYLKLHPKAAAAFLSAVAVVVVTVGNQALEVYADRWWVPIVAAAVTVAAAYAKRA